MAAKKVGVLIKEARTAAGLSQESLARKIDGVSATDIGKVERGDVIDAYALSFDAHFRLVTIHPWTDGNGRMSRLLMNHLQFEYQLIPMKVMKEQKAEYIQALVDVREQDDISVFRRVMFDLHIQNLQQEILQFRKSMEQFVIGDKQENVTDVTDRQHAIINLVKNSCGILEGNVHYIVLKSVISEPP